MPSRCFFSPNLDILNTIALVLVHSNMLYRPQKMVVWAGFEKGRARINPTEKIIVAKKTVEPALLALNE